MSGVSSVDWQCRREIWSVRCGSQSQGNGRHGRTSPAGAVPSAHHARAKRSICSRWRVNEFKIGAGHAMDRVKKSGLAAPTTPIPSARSSLLLSAGRQRGRSRGRGPLSAGLDGSRHVRRGRVRARTLPAGFHSTELAVFSSTAVLVCDTSSCAPSAGEPVRGVRYEWHRPVCRARLLRPITFSYVCTVPASRGRCPGPPGV